MPGIRAGRWILTIVGVFTAASSWIFDSGSTHMFNDRWPPHAKFHNAQTLLFGSVLGFLTLVLAWRRRDEATRNLEGACLFGSLYWLTQAGARLLPNTTLVDPKMAANSPRPFGLGGVQPIIDVVVLLSIVLACGLAKSGPNRRDS